MVGPAGVGGGSDFLHVVLRSRGPNLLGLVSGFEFSCPWRPEIDRFESKLMSCINQD